MFIIMEYKCIQCDKIFSQKSYYNKHLKRKTPCKKSTILKNVKKDKIKNEIKTMRYIGNKTKHLKFIDDVIKDIESKSVVPLKTIFDGFGGTGAVTHYFNKKNYNVKSNDINDFSYKLCYARNSITKDDLSFDKLKMSINDVIIHLNSLKKKGFIYYNYSPNKELSYERKYFTNDNAMKIDGIRTVIENWKTDNLITNKEYIFLIALLIESVSLFSNIPGTYGSFNKNWDSRSLKPFKLDEKLISTFLVDNNNQTYNNDIRNIISNVKCDILYLDPPYNERDYSIYYHVLETISKYDNPEINDNITGTKKVYNKSKWCNKTKSIHELEYVIQKTHAPYVILSYNNDGLISIDDIEKLFSKYGTYRVEKKLIKNNQFEYLHILYNSLKYTIPTPQPLLQIYNIIYNECCLTGMSKLDENCIDLICTDLPYGLTECKWSTPIDLDKLWNQYKRVLKPFGTIILFGQQPFTSRLVSGNYEMFKYSLVWQKSKTGGFAQAPYKVLCEHEDILIFSNGKTSQNAKNKMVYNPQGVIACNKKVKGKMGNSEYRKNRKSQKDYIQTMSNYPRSILKFNNEGNNIHPTQKPLDLIQYLIKTYSNVNDIVLDSCMGSGTTALACINTNRYYIGYEIDKKFYDIANNRIFPK